MSVNGKPVYHGCDYKEDYLTDVIVSNFLNYIFCAVNNYSN